MRRRRRFSKRRGYSGFKRRSPSRKGRRRRRLKSYGNSRGGIRL